MTDTEDPANGDACPRCDGTNTCAATHWEEPILVCDDCGCGT